MIFYPLFRAVKRVFLFLRANYGYFTLASGLKNAIVANCYIGPLGWADSWESPISHLNSSRGACEVTARWLQGHLRAVGWRKVNFSLGWSWHPIQWSLLNKVLLTLWANSPHLTIAGTKGHLAPGNRHPQGWLSNAIFCSPLCILFTLTWRTNVPICDCWYQSAFSPSHPVTPIRVTDF